MSLFRAANDDTYENFSALARCEREWRDYARLVENRASAIAVIAPHGGGIEPGTTELAKALAGDVFSLYCFNGMKPRENDTLHITSTHFDEPTCLDLVQRSHIVCALHGSGGKDGRVTVGGLHTELKQRVINALRSAGFAAEEDTGNTSGCDTRNICNRGMMQKGVQLEISEGLRRTMFKGLGRNERNYTLPLFTTFVEAVRNVLNAMPVDIHTPIS